MSAGARMNTSNATGFYGKLPAHGDFVHRNLPASVVNFWDDWLQSFVAGSREQLAEDWLDVYLTSPIWRFIFSHGVIDDNQWAGICLPSVDRVGRYFPFSILTKVSAETNPLEFMATQKTWYETMEQLCLSALEGKLSIDSLVTEINGSAPQLMSDYTASQQPPTKNGVVVDLIDDSCSPAATFAPLLDVLATNMLSSYSVWSTQGSELVAPCLFLAAGLPKPGATAAMLDGNWEQWGWQQPYSLKAIDNTL